MMNLEVNTYEALRDLMYACSHLLVLYLIIDNKYDRQPNPKP